MISQSVIKHTVLATSILMASSCAKHEKSREEYAIKLEKENVALRQEIQRLEEKAVLADQNINSLTRQLSYIQQEISSHLERKESSTSHQTSRSYFTIGSPEEDVINVMGNPTSVVNWPRTFYYGSSSIGFVNGRVSEYNNSSRNLKVRLKNGTSKNGDNDDIFKDITDRVKPASGLEPEYFDPATRNGRK